MWRIVFFLYFKLDFPLMFLNFQLPNINSIPKKPNRFYWNFPLTKNLLWKNCYSNAYFSQTNNKLLKPLNRTVIAHFKNTHEPNQEKGNNSRKVAKEQYLQTRVVKECVLSTALKTIFVWSLGSGVYKRSNNSLN